MDKLLLEKYVNRPGKIEFPIQYQCPEISCGKWDTTRQPECRQIMRKALVKAGRTYEVTGEAETLFMCHCNLTQEDIAREQHEKISQANLPNWGSQNSFVNFEMRTGTQEALTASQDFISMDKSKKILTLSGMPGCGKSHLAEAIARDALVEQKKRVKWISFADLADKINHSYSSISDTSKMQIIKDYTMNADLVVIDDIGTGNSTLHSTQFLQQITDYAINNNHLRLVITTNLTHEEMQRHFDERVASRIFNRNDSEIRVVSMTASNYRMEYQQVAV